MESLRERVEEILKDWMTLANMKATHPAASAAYNECVRRMRQELSLLPDARPDLQAVILEAHDYVSHGMPVRCDEILQRAILSFGKPEPEDDPFGPVTEAELDAARTELPRKPAPSADLVEAVAHILDEWSDAGCPVASEKVAIDIIRLLPGDEWVSVEIAKAVAHGAGYGYAAGREGQSANSFSEEIKQEAARYAYTVAHPAANGEAKS